MVSKSIFEKIIDKEIPSEIIFEDELCIVINDVNPQAPIHILIIPKKPLSKLSDALEEDLSLLGHLMLVAGNIIGLHRSRAEYFILTGRYDSAIFQLREGLKLSKNFFEIRESIINKLEQIYKTKRALKDLT